HVPADHLFHLDERAVGDAGGRQDLAAALELPSEVHDLILELVFPRVERSKHLLHLRGRWRLLLSVARCASHDAHVFGHDSSSFLPHDARAWANWTPSASLRPVLCGATWTERFKLARRSHTARRPVGQPGWPRS